MVQDTKLKMLSKKQLLRKKFKEQVFNRDNNKCKICKAPAVDAHHITDRNLMKNGGYTLSNGIALCSECHINAEAFHQNKKVKSGFYPSDLYKLINSSYIEALKDDVANPLFGIFYK